jgi:hypothetical protein
MIAKACEPITGVMNISSAGRIEMKAMETPASVPSSAARGVTLRIQGAMKPPIIRMKLWKNTQTRPASQPLMGSPVVIEAIGSMITKVTMNICGTLMPEGSAQTSRGRSSAPVCRRARHSTSVDRHIIRPSAGRMRPKTMSLASSARSAAGRSAPAG